MCNGAGAKFPLADSLARLDATVTWGTFQLMPGVPVTAALDQAGWLPCAHVLAGDMLDRWQALIATELARRHDVAPSQIPAIVPAAYQLGWYADVTGWTAAALFHRERRVPSCTPEHLAFRLDPDAYPAHVAVLSPSFACLPDDPDAAHPHARVLADEHALAAHLRNQVVGHAHRFFAAWQPGVRLGPRTRWGAISDILDSGPWAAAMEAGDESAGVASAAVLMADAEPPLLPGTRVYQGTDLLGRPFWSRHRHTCCFAYRLPGAQPCFSCPRTTDDERASRATSWASRH